MLLLVLRCVCAAILANRADARRNRNSVSFSWLASDASDVWCVYVAWMYDRNVWGVLIYYLQGSG